MGQMRPTGPMVRACSSSVQAEREILFPVVGLLEPGRKGTRAEAQGRRVAPVYPSSVTLCASAGETESEIPPSASPDAVPPLVPSPMHIPRELQGRLIPLGLHLRFVAAHDGCHGTDARRPLTRRRTCLVSGESGSLNRPAPPGTPRKSDSRETQASAKRRGIAIPGRIYSAKQEGILRC